MRSRSCYLLGISRGRVVVVSYLQMLLKCGRPNNYDAVMRTSAARAKLLNLHNFERGDSVLLIISVIAMA